MRLEVLTSAFAQQVLLFLGDLLFVCLPALYPEPLCQQHWLVVRRAPLLGHISNTSQLCCLSVRQPYVGRSLRVPVIRVSGA